MGQSPQVNVFADSSAPFDACWMFLLAFASFVLVIEAWRAMPPTRRRRLRSRGAGIDPQGVGPLKRREPEPDRAPVFPPGSIPALGALSLAVMPFGQYCPPLSFAPLVFLVCALVECDARPRRVTAAIVNFRIEPESVDRPRRNLHRFDRPGNRDIFRTALILLPVFVGIISLAPHVGDLFASIC